MPTGESKTLTVAQPPGVQRHLPAGEHIDARRRHVHRLDARGVISPTERQSFIARVRDLAKGSAEAWEKSQNAG